MELHIAGQLRRGPPGLSALLPGMLAAVVLARAQDQARGQGFVVQAGTVGPSHRDEPSDRRGPLWWDTGVLHLAGNQFAQRHGQIQAPIADDARGPEEQSLQFRQLWLSPIETPEGGVRVLDEVGERTVFGPAWSLSLFIERETPALWLCSAPQYPHCSGRLRRAIRTRSPLRGSRGEAG